MVKGKPKNNPPVAQAKRGIKTRVGWGKNDPSFETPNTIYTYGNPLKDTLRTNTHLYG